MAMELGVSDPLRFLAVDEADWELEVGFLQAAINARAEQRRAEIEAIGAAVGVKVAEVLGQMFR